MTYMAVATSPSKNKAYRIVSKDFYKKNKWNEKNVYNKLHRQ
jgi:hypothetical protein